MLVGTIGGIFTTLAGGGSLVVIPALIFLGINPGSANAANRFGILVACLTGIYNFKKKGYLNINIGLILGLPAAVGSIIGSNLVISLPDSIFNKVLITVMILMVGLISGKSITEVDSRKIYLSGTRTFFLALIFFIIGIYGGFIQAGVGIIIMVTLSLLTGYSLVEINSIKVFVIALYLIPSLFVFVKREEINWTYNLALFIGNYSGAYLGTFFSFLADSMLIKLFYLIFIFTLIFTTI